MFYDPLTVIHFNLFIHSEISYLLSLSYSNIMNFSVDIYVYPYKLHFYCGLCSPNNLALKQFYKNLIVGNYILILEFYIIF